MRHAVAIAATILLATGAHAQTPVPANPLDTIPDAMPFNAAYGAPIGLDRAQAVIAGAVAETKKRGWALNITVVDTGGNLVAFARMDGAQLASIAISEHKARAANNFRRETKAYENAIQSGLNYILSVDGVIGSRGGIPLMQDGKIVGAIGVSGGTGSQDEVAAKAGVAALQ